MIRLLKPIMRPIARRKLIALHQERDRIEAAIARARKSRSMVSGLYRHAQAVQTMCWRWERWL